MKTHKTEPLVLNFAFLIAIVVSGGVCSTPAQDADRKTAEQLSLQIEQLEKQMGELRQELSKLKEFLNEKKAAGASSPTDKSAEVQKAGVPQDRQTQSRSSGQGKSPIGIDLGGNIKLVPYGTIFFNAFGNSGGTNNTDVPLWATPAGHGNLSASARQTRLGARLQGAKIGDASLSAVIEADFYGGFPAIGIGENFGVVRLRLAHARINWERTSLVVGQDWSPFAPISPTSIAAAAIPQLAAAGNPWARLPQVRVERKIGDRLLWQGAILAPQTGDFPPTTNSPALLQPGAGAASRIPFFQARLAFSDPNWLGAKKAGSVGISAHYGRARVGIPNNAIDSVGVALDWNFPIVPRLGISGEAFTGRNLAGFQAGIFQNYNADFAYLQGSTFVAGGVRSIGTIGGWMQAWFMPDILNDRLTLYASIGMDDPRNKDLVSVSVRDWRARNLAYALNFIYKPIPQISLGGEFRRFETHYSQSGRRTAKHFNLGAAYSF